MEAVPEKFPGQPHRKRTAETFPKYRGIPLVIHERFSAVLALRKETIAFSKYSDYISADFKKTLEYDGFYAGF